MSCAIVVPSGAIAILFLASCVLLVAFTSPLYAAQVLVYPLALLLARFPRTLPRKSPTRDPALGCPIPGREQSRVALAFLAAALVLDRVMVSAYVLFIALSLILIHVECLFLYRFTARAIRGAGRSTHWLLAPIASLALAGLAVWIIASLSKWGFKEKDPELGWISSPSRRAEINLSRMRGPEVAREKAPGALRILALGDSVTFGLFVREEISFPRILEKSLLTACGAHQAIEVLNAGVPGFAARDGARFLDSRLLVYQPDLILVLFGFNDARVGEPVEEFRRAMIEILESSRRAGAKVLLLTYPPDAGGGSVEKYNEALGNISAEEGVPLLSLEEIRTSSTGPRLFFYDHLHPNREGHRRIADLLSRKIREGEVLGLAPECGS